MNKDLKDYYRLRAKEYEKIYHKPERQTDLAHLAQTLPNHFSNCNILEIGCGTGYWTPFLAREATSILATDINHSVLEMAQAKFANSDKVSFLQSDMYALNEINDVYDGIFAGFVWSHILIEKLPEFLQHLHKFVVPGGKMVFLDNQFVQGSNTPIHSTDDGGNSYQKRFLDDGTAHLVLKNFPDDSFLSNLLKGIGENIQIQRLTYFWTLTYQVS